MCMVQVGDEVMCAGSFYSQNDMALYFGLGEADSLLTANLLPDHVLDAAAYVLVQSLGHLVA